jgi:hypothetical protein
MLISDRLTELVSGYERLRKAEHQLPERWRHEVMAAYARRQEAFEARQARHQRQLRLLRRGTAWVGGGVLLFLVVSSVLPARIADALPDLFCVGLLVGLALAVLWLVVGLLQRPNPPQHPLKPPLHNQLFPRLYPQWRRGMKGSMTPGTPDDHGWEGEAELIRALEARIGADTFILHRLQQNYGDDIDVVVVGSRGVWVFEVKFWSGRITWRQGDWTRKQTYYREGGERVVKERTVRQSPDRQWRRMVDEVKRTLQRHVPHLMWRLPKIRGGVAFTCDNAKYDISQTAPFAWGTTRGWADYVADARPLTGFEVSTQLQVLETLLSRHRQVSGREPQRSMAAYAQQLIEETEARLQQWVDEI